MRIANPGEVMGRLPALSSESASQATACCVSDEESVSRLAAQIRGYTRGALLEFACTVGRLILDEFYHGDREFWRSHASVKESSFRKLAELLDGAEGLSVSALCRSVATYDLVQRLGGLNRLNHLTATHVRTVLALPFETQKQLLECAERERWSVRILEERAAAETDRRRTKSIVSQAVCVRTIQLLGQYADDGDRFFPDIDKLAELDAKTRTRLHGILIRLRERCELLESSLNRPPKTRRLVNVHSLQSG
jgi:hypothetical protein